jgi:hypothetical protein
MAGMAAMIWVDLVCAEDLSLHGGVRVKNFEFIQQAIAAGTVFSGVEEKTPEAASVSMPTGAWLISIGLIGFIVSRRRFRKKDD